jgi:hypothetical protein
MFTQPRQEPLSIRSARRLKLLVLVGAVLACFIPVGAGWFIDHGRYHQVTNNLKKALLTNKQEVVWVRGKLAESKVEMRARAEAFSKSHDKMKQEALQGLAQGLARTEALKALLGEETAMRHKLDQMLEKEKAARISAQTLLTEEKELRMQLEAQHEEFVEKHRASLKML